MEIIIRTCAGDCRDDDASITPRTDSDGDGFVYCDDCDDSDALNYVGNAYMDSTTECMIDVDEDGYGADLTLTCCLEIEMFDNTNGDWEGAQVELELGENVQYFSLEEGGEAISSFCLTEEERLNVNFISGDWDSEVRLSFETQMEPKCMTVDLLLLKD